jgi:hypothetical protein
MKLMVALLTLIALPLFAGVMNINGKTYTCDGSISLINNQCYCNGSPCEDGGGSSQATFEQSFQFSLSQTSKDVLADTSFGNLVVKPVKGSGYIKGVIVGNDEAKVAAIAQKLNKKQELGIWSFSTNDCNMASSNNWAPDLNAIPVNGVSEIQKASGISVQGTCFGYLEIGLPRMLDLDRIYLETSSGHLMIQGLSANEMGLESSSGSVQAKQLRVNDFDAKASSGQVVVEECGLRSASVRTSSGKVFVKNIKGDALKVRTSSGVVSLDNVQPETYVKTSSGHLYVKNMSKDNVSFDTSSGKIH